MLVPGWVSSRCAEGVLVVWERELAAGGWLNGGEPEEEAEGEELERLSQENDADVHECLSEVAEALSAGRTLEARDAAVRLIYLQRIAEAVKKKE